MRKDSVGDVITTIKNKGLRLGIVYAGGGSSLATRLINFGGASDILDHVYCPYSKEAMTDYLGKEPEKYVSAETASLLAHKATEEMSRARWINHVILEKQKIAIAITASYYKDGERDGRINNAFVSILEHNKEYIIEVEFNKSEMLKNFVKKIDEPYITNNVRDMCDNLLSMIIVDVINKDSCKMQASFIDRYLNKVKISKYSLTKERVVTREASDDPLVRAFVLDSYVDEKNSNNQILFPGSFNPIHDGHREIIDLIQKETNREVVLEISNRNRNKGYISNSILFERFLKLSNSTVAPITISSKCYMYEKVQPYAGIVMGWDIFQNFISDSIVKDLAEYEETVDGSRFVLGDEIINAFKGKTIYVIARGMTKEEFNKTDEVFKRFINIKDLNIVKIFNNNPLSSSEIRKKA